MSDTVVNASSRQPRSGRNDRVATRWRRPTIGLGSTGNARCGSVCERRTTTGSLLPSRSGTGARDAESAHRHPHRHSERAAESADPAAPVVTTNAAPAPPNLPTAAPVITPGATPSLPTAAPAAAPTHDSPSDDSAPTTGEHPMAHLMPTKAMPTEASRRAAETCSAEDQVEEGQDRRDLRNHRVHRRRRTTARRMVVDAINEAGDTTVEQPAK